jgi:hypothetical protein
MKKNLTKIVIALSCTIFISACHTLEHNGFKLKPLNKLTTVKISDDNNNYKSNSLPEKSEVKKIIKKTAVKPNINKIKKTEIKRFNPKSILNLSEKQLLQKMGKSDFVKHEGKLKNHQYYFPNCFVDIFVIKREGDYFVDFFQKRSIKLNGFLNEQNCFKDISNKIRILEQ